jgi:alpha-glucosidase
MNYFNKIPFIGNFTFAESLTENTATVRDQAYPLDVSTNGDGIFRVASPLRHQRAHASHAELSYRPGASTAGDDYAFALDTGKGFRLSDKQGHVLLQSMPGKALGLCGAAFMCCFEHHPDYRYYGMGEKLLGLELTGVKTKFWNTDAFGDFDGDCVINGRVDPYYVSIPYIIVRTPHGWVGLLLNNPYMAYASTAAEVEIEGLMSVRDEGSRAILFGSEDGELDLYVLAAPSLPALTRKLQTLVGSTPLPPLWALGFQQCRWGYRSASDLRDVRDRAAEHGIPVDGLWLDIDYMDGYRVFTFDADAFPDPAADIAALRENGQQIVPIIDPGVKVDHDYRVYQDGQQHDVFCRNPEGTEFHGIVWPGETAFPDFSLPEVRAWWAGHVSEFAALGFEGAWVDMNDPSVGPVNMSDMLFNKGQDPHPVFHNQYGAAMARATQEGFCKANPDLRPFVVTRSSFLGAAKYAAVWTGDNASNYHYLRQSIPTCINLALSGIPFTGGDVGGFAHNCSDALLRDWTRAGFLMPFFRNHCEHGGIPQEPWSRDEHTLAVCREFIRARYKLMPYIYQLFVAQEECGEAILRPLFYDFDNLPDAILDRVDDQFMLGTALLQAPILHEGATTRDVVLPGAAVWYSILDGQWKVGGCTLRDVSMPDTQTGLYLRGGQIVPMRPGIPEDHKTSLHNVEMHVLVHPDAPHAVIEYIADDGRTFAYRNGRRSRMRITADWTEEGICITTEALADGHGPIIPTFIVYTGANAVFLNGAQKSTHPHVTRLAGADLATRIVIK